MSEQMALFPPPPALPDQAERDYAVDPAHNVVLEASAGTGKTTVLVQRYLNLLRAGVDPANILAITFTRKAAAEMRERVIRELKRGAAVSKADRERWIALRDRLAQIDISTIDAFCLSLLREFPLEAGLDPGFSMADETEVPRLIEESLDRALRICLLRAREDEELGLVLAQLGVSRARVGLTHLLQRRLVAHQALNRFLAGGPEGLGMATVCRGAARRVHDALQGVPDGLERFIADGPLHHPRFRALARDLAQLASLGDAEPAAVRGTLERLRRHFLTLEGQPRRNAGLPPYRAEHCASPEAWRRHREAIASVSPHMKEALDAFARDLNVILARGVRQMFWIALNEYRRTLEERSVLDFSDVLDRAIELLKQMDEFAQSRFRLEARYHHVLVDEFQDTSRAQWQLVSLLIEAWGEGRGLAAEAPLPPSIFIVGDRKQSIYRFRDAEVTVLQEAAEYIRMLRPGGAPARRAIAFSFRARPALLAFVNDVFGAIEKTPRRDAFTFDRTDRFPLPDAASAARVADRPAVALLATDTPEASAAAVAGEIARLLDEATVRDRDSGQARRARPEDIAILFRSRASHREFEEALETRAIPAYVYKGLGFFDADEIKDLVALLRFLADPSSSVRAAAFLRSRFVRISDEGLCRLARMGSHPISKVLSETEPDAVHVSPADAARLQRARRSVSGWLRLVDQVPPAELLDQILADAAYDYELRGARRAQARENVKKMRALIRRIQNRGYPTLRRIAEHLDSLSAGDESNAALEAVNAVNLMTVHAAKGLEFPIVFVVNLAKGASGPPPPVRVVADTADGEPSVSVASYISEADQEQRNREAEETKRLLYVALTRARDALYLATVLKDGEMRPGRGSLGEVLPDTIRALFSAAAPATGEIDWTGPSGERHRMRLVPPAEPPGAAAADPFEATPRREAFGPVTITADAPRIAATQYVLGDTEDGAGRPLFAPARDLIVGTLVHRLFQNRVAPEDDLTRRARALLRPEERAQLGDEDETVAAAAALFAALATRDDVSAILDSGACEYEVPFSLRIDPAAVGAGTLRETDMQAAVKTALASPVVLRGTVDCLIHRPDGSIVVVEFKTGRRRPEHARQLEIYVAAVRAMFPGARVEGRVMYP